MDFNLSAHQVEVAENARIFAEKEICGQVNRLEEDLEYRRQLFKKMACAGFFTLSVEGDALAYALALKRIAKEDAGISVAMTVTNMVAQCIQMYGTKEQEKYIQSIKAGLTVPAAFALTEKDTGSDAKHISMQATLKEENGRKFYVLEGEKHLISNGDIAGFMIVIAMLQDRGATAFIVDRQTPGLSVICKEQKLGLLTANLVRLKFSACIIPFENRLGHEGEGLKIALRALDSGRLGIAAQSMGIGEAAFEAAHHYAKHREQFGEPLVNFQAIAFKLADMQVKLTAGMALLYQACWMHDSKLDCRSISAQAKLFCSEAANEIATEALQIYGGYGYIKSNPVEKYFRDARATTIYEGTSEIQRLLISRLL